MSTLPTIQQVAVAEQTVRALARAIVQKFNCGRACAQLTIDTNGEIEWSGYQPGIWVGLGVQKLRSPAEVLDSMPDAKAGMIAEAKRVLAQFANE